MISPSQPETSAIPGAEIVELFRRAIRREVKIVAVGCSWNDVYAGNVYVRIDGYELVIFNDCSQLDYVDKATAPDGRRGDFDEWWLSNTEPVELMSDDEGRQLEFLLENAPVVEPLQP